MLQFPTGFVWGAATSAQQVEGAMYEDGAGSSIWRGFAGTPGNVLNDDAQDVACDHYHRYRDDVSLLKELGLPSYQFSASWSRVMPDGVTINQPGLDFYDRLVDELLAHGISPTAVVYTWEMPEVVGYNGGWLNRTCALRLADYASVLFDRLGDRVDRWLTMCEPMSIAHYGYVEGDLAPGIRDIRAGLVATHHVLLAHGMVVDRFRSSSRHGEIGIINAMADLQPASSSAPDREAARRTMDYYHALYLDPILKGTYPESMRQWFGDNWPDVALDGDMGTISEPVDFIGIDYYCSSQITNTSPDPGLNSDTSGTEIGAAGPIGSTLARLLEVSVVPPAGRVAVSDIGWELHPRGIYNVLMWLHERYPNTPLMITEIGAAFEDEVDTTGKVHDINRLRYLHETLIEAHRAIEAGVDLRGCYVWSFLDTWEYNLGYSARFGIVHVDFKTQRRSPKESAIWFGSVARANCLPDRP